MTTYPVETAQELVEGLNALGSKNGAEIFLGELMDDPRGCEYRRVVVDVTRTHWMQMRAALVAAGWHSYGEGSYIHELPGKNYLLAEPNF